MMVAGARVTVIRQPLWYRFVLAGTAVAAGAVVGPVSVISLAHGDRFAIVALLLLAWFLGFPYRLYRVSIEVHEDRLRIRNLVRTREIQREGIAGFRIDTSWWQGPMLKAVYVIPRDSQPIELSVTRRLDLRPRSREQLDGWLDGLQSWKSQQPPISPGPAERDVSD